jgi:hypothetical protein
MCTSMQEPFFLLGGRIWSLEKKGGRLMAQMTSQTEYREEGVGAIANPGPLGLLILALATALVGASFAHFLIPNAFLGLGTVVTPVLVYAGVILVLAGMWAFRKNHVLGATLFSAYGGFLIAFGVLFWPTIGLTRLFGLDILAFNHALGLLFLCWTICCGVLFLASLRTNMLLAAVLAFLCLSYLFLTIGEFANANTALLAIGGWLGIICALISWYASLAGILQATRSPFQLPVGERGRAPVPPYGGEPAV